MEEKDLLLNAIRVAAEDAVRTGSKPDIEGLAATLARLYPKAGMSRSEIVYEIGRALVRASLH